MESKQKLFTFRRHIRILSTPQFARSSDSSARPSWFRFLPFTPGEDCGLRLCTRWMAGCGLGGHSDGFVPMSDQFCRRSGNDADKRHTPSLRKLWRIEFAGDVAGYRGLVERGASGHTTPACRFEGSRVKLLIAAGGRAVMYFRQLLLPRNGCRVARSEKWF